MKIQKTEPEDLIGPFYDAAGLQRRWGYSELSLDAMCRSNQILGILTDEGEILYPTWQFDQNNQPHGWIKEVADALAGTGADHFAVALWLKSPVYGYGDELVSAADFLASGGDRALVLWHAAADVERMSH